MLDKCYTCVVRFFLFNACSGLSSPAGRVFIDATSLINGTAGPGWPFAVVDALISVVQ